MPRCGHKQDMPCHQNPMGVKCQTVVAKLLRGCGHSKSMPCHQSPFLEGCIVMCEKPCPKGHPCGQECHHKRVCKPCLAIVTVTFPNCSHKQPSSCHRDPAQIKCLAKCEKSCTKRNHPCRLKCHQQCQNCEVRMDVTLKCGHSASVQCSVADKFACTRMVDVTLSCGHSTSIMCSKDVNSVICYSMVDVTLEKMWAYHFNSLFSRH